MKTLCICAMFGAVLLSAEEMKVTVTCDPALPIQQNLIAGYNFDKGLTSWKVSKPETSSVAFDDQMKKNVLKLSTMNKSVYRVVPVKLVTPGKYYIASCMINPDAQINTKKTSGGSGIGFSLTFWKPKWARGASVGVFGGGRQEWHKIVGKPVQIPEGLANGQLHVSISYSPGTGSICDLCVAEAYTQMTIDVTSPEAPIRQVKVMDDAGKVVFDSGILNGKENTFKKTLQVETPYRYTVLAVANDGDVKSVVYPAVTTPAPEQPKPEAK